MSCCTQWLRSLGLEPASSHIAAGGFSSTGLRAVCNKISRGSREERVAPGDRLECEEDEDEEEDQSDQPTSLFDSSKYPVKGGVKAQCDQGSGGDQLQ